MSDRAQRVLDALMDYDDGDGHGYPITSIKCFFGTGHESEVEKDYEELTAEEEKQVIKAFLEFAY